MAYILLVDPDEVAQRAMKGILARGEHRFVAVGSAAEAWDIIQRSAKVDLLIAELKLTGDGGLTLIERLKNDRLLKSLPTIVYAGNVDRESLKRVLNLHVQNFLLKPYRDDSVFAEISKALKKPWREEHFEPANAWCQKLGIANDQLRSMRERVRSVLEKAGSSLPEYADRQAAAPLAEALGKITILAEKVGATGIVACLAELKSKVLDGEWARVKEGAEMLTFAARLIAEQLDPTHCPEDFLTTEELNSENEARERALWATAAEENRCPVIGWEQLQREMDALSGCPVIDSIAASFQMSANGHPTSLSPLLDLVNKDPGLTAQILIASNRLKKKGEDGDTSAIEEPRVAIGLLGELRLATLGGSLETVEERLLLAPPHSSWPNFRMFQLATARLARFTCDYLELPALQTAAYTAGLIHDMGKLLLIHLHPFAFQAIHDHAVRNGMKLAAAERIFLTTTTHEMAAYFAEKQGLPRPFVNVLRWMDDPESATCDTELVAVVSLARDLCRHNHVGFCGDTPSDDAIPLEETPEWKILRSRVYLNFDLKKFELQAHRECLQLKRELLDQVSR